MYSLQWGIISNLTSSQHQPTGDDYDLFPLRFPPPERSATALAFGSRLPMGKHVIMYVTYTYPMLL